MKNIVILYHADCSDGFGGAYAAWKKFKNRAEYIAVRYSESLPENLAGKEVFMIDFCYSGANLDYLLKNTKLTIIDHHIGAKEDVLKASSFVFELNNSGSVLAWKYFFPKKEAPKILLYVEDKDLWRWKLKESDAIYERLSAEKKDFNIWDKFGKKLQDKNGFKELVKDGKILVKFRENLLDEIIEKSFEVDFDGVRARVVNSSVFNSRVCNRLIKMGYSVGITWFSDGNRNIISLRSDGETDVCELAKKYGGGGHKAASGFSLQLD